MKLHITNEFVHNKERKKTVREKKNKNQHLDMVWAFQWNEKKK